MTRTIALIDSSDSPYIRVSSEHDGFIHIQTRFHPDYENITLCGKTVTYRLSDRQCKGHYFCDDCNRAMINDIFNRDRT